MKNANDGGIMKTIDRSPFPHLAIFLFYAKIPAVAEELSAAVHAGALDFYSSVFGKTEPVSLDSKPRSATPSC